MIDDKTFGTIVALVGGGLFLHIALSNYGYDNAIHVLKVSSVILGSLGVLVLGVIFIAKKLPKKEPEIIVQRKPRRRLPKITDIPEPKEETVKSLEQMEPKDSYERPVATARPRVRVTASTDVKFYKLKGMKKQDVDYLKRYGYKIRSYLNPFVNKKEKFIFKNRHESNRHFLMIHVIADFLKGKVNNLKTFETVKPDITFEIGDRKFAIEVETGKILKYARKQLPNKVKLLNKDYDSWFFVVTDKNFARKYKDYGKVVDKRGVANYLKKLLKSVR